MVRSLRNLNSLIATVHKSSQHLLKNCFFKRYCFYCKINATYGCIFQKFSLLLIRIATCLNSYQRKSNIFCQLCLFQLFFFLILYCQTNTNYILTFSTENAPFFPSKKYKNTMTRFAGLHANQIGIWFTKRYLNLLNSVTIVNKMHSRILFG